jgi:DDE superfamily endonuclease
MLGCIAEGGKFDPYIIWKGKNTPSGQICQQIHCIEYNGDFTPVHEGLYTSNYYAVQETAWMELTLVVEWLQKVYQNWALVKDQPTILILDEFARHKTSEVRDGVSLVGGHLILIPGGCTF